MTFKQNRSITPQSRPFIQLLRRSQLTSIFNYNVAQPDRS